ncbi:twin-arginine translocation signal domain-containing protein [Hufsiella ginkgonis]|uniref:Twin-arginine translocation signal domain-containing protein n=1 Tax=Hufsiella ginkgonis TaxID=2695274 RepID=A0A7K1XYD2_9SPHI|nr:twin-arginine translocation signal domain-containing protein [Hufsiella ginkgonis]MXV16005.1 twin-arginine translocation signal domain-containing protein [Hufsiella ginkgonis]
MKQIQTRRDFIRTTAIAGAAAGFQLPDCFAAIPTAASSPLYALSKSLVEQWAKALLALQVTDAARDADYGGIWCPANKLVHGRVADSIYPFAYMAAKTSDSRYLDASVLLYRWMERRVSQDDGSWLNEPVKGSWKGTTVFTIIAFCETLKNHGAILDPSFKKEMEDRLRKAGEYVYDTFSIDYGNINYPISASYALTLLGTLLDIPKYREKGKMLAKQTLPFFTKEGFLYGEGRPYDQPSKKGCFSVDLGYNVEESLPSLVLYGLFTGDEEVLAAATRSLQTHMEFMLPDGGWDNSWGTRNYKWTYWGSRTSDGCQPAYALLADRDPRFYKAALRNTELLRQCTDGGLLYGGPHYRSHQVPPSVHHTFCHIKALTTILDHGNAEKKYDLPKIVLPREKVYGGRFFNDIQTCLVSTGKFRATVTGYDREYHPDQNGHASGGALSMLWHEHAGPILAASMTDYTLIEAGNMQADNDPLSMPLTPRLEWRTDHNTYRNISDLQAVVSDSNEKGKVMVKTRSRLVDKAQKDPSTGPVHCEVSYMFSAEKVVITFTHDQPENREIRLILPVISRADETVRVLSDRKITVKKARSTVTILSDQLLTRLPVTQQRLFNFVPGLEAVPISAGGGKITIEILVS